MKTLIALLAHTVPSAKRLPGTFLRNRPPGGIDAGGTVGPPRPEANKTAHPLSHRAHVFPAGAPSTGLNAAGKA